MSVSRFILPALIAAVSSCPSWGENLWVGRFSESGVSVPSPWRIERIDERVPATRYQLSLWDGVYAIEARANKSMALMGRPLEIDLQHTPIMCWQWRIDAPVVAADMTRKDGDDYAARVYLTFEMAPDQLSFTTRAKLGLARSIYGGQVPDAALNLSGTIVIR